LYGKWQRAYEKRRVRLKRSKKGLDIKMEIYFAPMEGITGYVYRNAFHSLYSGVDKYFTPFLSPNQNRVINPKEKRDIQPEHNKGMDVVPQILTNNSELFIRAAKELEEIYGYKEVNLNLGCPSRTVTAKGKGAGFLGKREELDAFLDKIFEKVNINISIKTRIGVESQEEFPYLLEIYNKYPLKELIIHPRLQRDFYKGKPNWKEFARAVKESPFPLCYNGDIFTVGDYEHLKREFPRIERIMLGRGLLRNPMLSEILKKSGEICESDKKRLWIFHNRLYGAYREVMSGDRNVLFKMKEFWAYSGYSFPGEEKMLKKIKKASKLKDYEQAVDNLFGMERE